MTFGLPAAHAWLGIYGDLLDSSKFGQAPPWFRYFVGLELSRLVFCNSTSHEKSSAGSSGDSPHSLRSHQFVLSDPLHEICERHGSTV